MTPDIDAALEQLDAMHAAEQLRAQALAYLTGMTSSLALSVTNERALSDDAAVTAEELLRLVDAEDLRDFVRELGIIGATFVLAHPTPMDRLDELYRALAPTVTFWQDT